MVDVVTLRNIAQEVRSFAVQIRCNNQAVERAATEMEDAAYEIEHLRASQSK